MSASAAASRRPPRKSTLTQQQKNQKRQRATQDQLLTLEMEFNKNPTPTALVRERIASDINMTERSVQIWFQNRRAKIKNIAKKSIESGEDCDSIPESMRQYLAMQAYGPGKGLANGIMGRNGYGYANGTLCLNTDASSGKTVIHHFHCRSLSVGTWRRVGQSTMDLVIFYSAEKACVTYYINNDSAGYKIEYPFSSIKNIQLEQGDVLAAAEGASQRSGGLIIELNRPPRFFMDSASSGGFYECGDFTEDQQASQIMVHHLGGPSKVLSGQLAKLVSLEAYQNRHNHFDHNMYTVSAPVSPVGHRPASQPNHMLHPHTAMTGYFPHDQPGMMGPPGPRGHKRQRSRSVPAAIDFNQLRHPMPSFLIQHEGQPPQPPQMHDPNIFAPQPQHHHQSQFAPAPMGSNLSLDTGAGFGMDMRHFGAPMSATTANSPSDFGTPGFFGPSAQGADGGPNAHFASAGNGFLAVDPSSMIGTSNTPLSVASHGDPVIADHSPPLSGVGRSQSFDAFGTPGENSQFGEDGMFLSESFNKQMALPFRSPMTEDSFHSPMPDGSFSFQTPPAGGSDGQLHYTSQDGHVNFPTPPSQSQDGSLTYHSPGSHSQVHQDSGIAFSTPTNVSHDQGHMFEDSKMYQSPGQMHQHPDEQHLYPTGQLNHSSSNEHIDFQQMYGTIDPTSLGPHRQH
ncbi:hypothetical protein K431DRAFT_229769 [Polychaeton citri CBS 116435]|uniref:Homeobox domain-containing protein n=1 Tax=Polychaeton citri CBS 116435 TaxID=1314669 RepID=A0A9P4Q6H8_9PEZI|nr:hypothetical protein K431DRAFT_229769 [Polychaeton citri CBS 116435]